MKITNILVNLTNQIINDVILLSVTFFFGAYLLYNAICKKIDALDALTLILLFLFLFVFLVFILKFTCDNKKSYKYTIYYKSKYLPKELTTKEIIDEIMKKNFFDNEIDEISVLTITIPSGDFNDIFLQHINQMKEETQKKEDQKFLENEIHKLK